MPTEFFEIFSGDPKRNPKWIGTERTKEKAEERMTRLAVEKPGQYFVWSSSTQKLIAEIDSGTKPA